MSIIKGVITSFDQVGVRESLSDVLGLVAPYETPLLDRFLQNGLRYPAVNTTHSWIEDDLPARGDALDGAIDDATTSVVVDDATKFAIGMVIQVEDEQLYVSDVDEGMDTITATRGYNNTTAAAHADGEIVYIVSRPALDGADAAEARSTQRTLRSNYTQIFERAVSVSGTSNAVRLAGIADEYSYQVESRLREIKLEMQRVAVMGRSNVGSSTVPRQSAGLLELISTNELGSIGALLMGDIDDACESIWLSGGNPDLWVVDSATKKGIAGWNRIKQEAGNDESKVGGSTTVFESAHGNLLAVLPVRDLPVGTNLILDSTRIGFGPLTGRELAHVALSRSGDAIRGQVIGEYALEMYNEDTAAKLTGITSVDADGLA
jgi:hypothetical protein